MYDAVTNFYQILKIYFSKPLRLLGNIYNVNEVDCSSVLRVTCPFLFVCVFCDSFLCSISLLLLSDSLSCVLNTVYIFSRTLYFGEFSE